MPVCMYIFIYIYIYLYIYLFMYICIYTYPIRTPRGVYTAPLLRKNVRDTTHSFVCGITYSFALHESFIPMAHHIECMCHHCYAAEPRANWYADGSNAAFGVSFHSGPYAIQYSSWNRTLSPLRHRGRDSQSSKRLAYSPPRWQLRKALGLLLVMPIAVSATPVYIHIYIYIYIYKHTHT